jgi:hypothetical protein
MSQPEPTRGGRLRAYFHFLLAVLFYFFARTLATHTSQVVADDRWSPLVNQILLAVLLFLGYAVMGFWLNRQQSPISEQGLPPRADWFGEAGSGLAFGWCLALVCVLPLTVFGGIAVSFSFDAPSWGWFAIDAAFFLFAALAEEIAFRGYGFQRFARAVGPFGATVGFALFYAIVQGLLPGASRASFFVSLALGLLLSTAYLRTNALWLSWGLNFGWKVTRALLFGLAVNGVSSNSPVIQGDPMGPFWLTGGGFGLDASWAAFIVLLVAIPVLYRVTGDLNFRYNAPLIVGAGIPVDLDAAARAQHTAAMGEPQPPSPVLVQIGPATPSSPAPATDTSANPGTGA